MTERSRVRALLSIQWCIVPSADISIDYKFKCTLFMLLLAGYTGLQWKLITMALHLGYWCNHIKHSLLKSFCIYTVHFVHYGRTVHEQLVLFIPPGSAYLRQNKKEWTNVMYFSFNLWLGKMLATNLLLI